MIFTKQQISINMLKYYLPLIFYLSTFAEMKRLSSESSLIDFSFRSTREWETIWLEFKHCSWSLLGHVMDGILITEPIWTLNGIKEVPFPVVLSHVSEGCIDTTLSSDGVRTSWEQLGDTSSLETFLDETKSGSKTSTTGTNYYCIISMVNNGVFIREISLLIFNNNNH